MKQKENFLEYVPVINEKYKWHIDENDIVTVEVLNTGLFNKIAQTLFKAPKISNIKLDEKGSKVWQQIDGKKDVGDIALNVREAFNEKEDNAFYGGVIKFFRILQDNKFIYYKNK